MKRGDLVRIVNITLYPGESQFGLFWHDDQNEIFYEWGDQVARECDCVVLWNGGFVPFNSQDLVKVND